MKCGEPSNEKKLMSNLDNLDRALHDLGMLSSITDVRRDYLKETHTGVGVMRMNTRFVSNVTVGLCMKKTPQKARSKPYNVPARHRTKSENSDGIVDTDKSGSASVCDSILIEPSTSLFAFSDSKYFKPKKKVVMKRCQSLENINSTDIVDVEPSPSQDMEGVSHRIEKLQFNE